MASRVSYLAHRRASTLSTFSWRRTLPLSERKMLILRPHRTRMGGKSLYQSFCVAITQLITEYLPGWSVFTMYMDPWERTLAGAKRHQLHCVVKSPGRTQGTTSRSG